MSDKFDIPLLGQNVVLDRNPNLSSTLIATFGYLFYVPAPEGHESNYVNNAIDLLVEQFRTARKGIPGVVAIQMRQKQLVEDTAYDLQRFRNIDSATGIQLDNIGEIVGLSRTSTVDDEYRNDLKFQIWVNVSSGQPETIIAVIAKTLKCTVSLVECYPKSIIVHCLNIATGSIPNNICKQLRRVVQGGTGIDIRTNNNDQFFAFAGTAITPPHYPNARGFGCVNSTTKATMPEYGGHFTVRITK